MNTDNDDVDDDEFTRSSSLSVKTKAGYVQVYKTFMEWKAKRSAGSLSEDLILAYFKEKSVTNLPSTLGAIYYMLKFTLLANNDVDITSYSKLRNYLRQTRGGYRSTPTKVFTANEVDSFLRFAPDRCFLDLKVVVILAVFGDMSTDDLKNLSMDDVELHENLMFVKIPSSKTVPSRSFVITDFQNSIVKRYLDLRPKNFDSRILLLTYRDGRCFNQPMDMYAYNIDVDQHEYKISVDDLLIERTNMVNLEKTFTTDEVDTFLRLAPEQTFLDMKVTMMCAVLGNMTTEDLNNLTLEDVELYENVMFVKPPNRTSALSRSFVITDFQYHIFKRYLNLHLNSMNNKSLLLAYKDGECFNKSIGMKNINAMPEKIATFLGLSDPDKYTWVQDIVI